MILEKDDTINSLKDDEKKGIVEILENDETHIEYYDNEQEGYRFFYFPETETLESFKNRIFFSDKASKYYNSEEITRFIFDIIDKNALMVLQKLYFVWDDSDYEKIYNETDDEYALYIMDNEYFGITWVEKSIIIINVKKMIEEIKNTEKEDLRLGYNSH